MGGTCSYFLQIKKLRRVQYQGRGLNISKANSQWETLSIYVLSILFISSEQRKGLWVRSYRGRWWRGRGWWLCVLPWSTSPWPCSSPQWGRAPTWRRRPHRTLRWCQTSPPSPGRWPLLGDLSGDVSQGLISCILTFTQHIKWTSRAHIFTQMKQYLIMCSRKRLWVLHCFVNNELNIKQCIP